MTHLVDDHQPDRETHRVREGQDSVHVVILGDQYGPGKIDCNRVGHCQKNCPDPAAKIGRHIPDTPIPCLQLAVDKHTESPSLTIKFGFPRKQTKCHTSPSYHCTTESRSNGRPPVVAGLHTEVKPPKEPSMHVFIEQQ